MSLSTFYMGTPLYEMALELAEQFTDDFDTQEEFIEGVLTAYTAVARPEHVTRPGGTSEATGSN